MHQRLVEQERAACRSAPARGGLRSRPRLGIRGGTAGFAVAKTEALIDEEIARLAKDGPSAAELAKARNQALAGFWRGLQTINGKAQALGTYEVFHGDYRKLVRRAGGVRKASPPRT